MKRNYSKEQYVQIAKEKMKEVFLRLPSVERVETTAVFEVQRQGDFKLEVFLQNAESPISFIAEVKPIGERRIAVSYVSKFQNNCFETKRKENYIFIAPYISSETASILKDNGLNYMDLCGNCYIFTGQILIAIDGKQNSFADRTYNRNYFSRSATIASMIMRTLLFCSQTTIWNVSVLAGAANASLGAVSNVKRFLAENTWVEDCENGFRIKNRGELIRAWAKEYGKGRDIVYQFYSLDDIPFLEDRISEWNNTHDTVAPLGFFAAAARYAPTVRYNKLHVYLRLEDLAEFERFLELKEVSSGGNVLVVIPHDSSVCRYLRVVNGAYITTPEQTVLDLMNVPARGEEAAEAIIQKEFE